MAASLPIRRRIAANTWTNFTALGAGKQGIIVPDGDDFEALPSAVAPAGAGVALVRNTATAYNIPAGAAAANLWVRSTAGGIVTVTTAVGQLIQVDAT